MSTFSKGASCPLTVITILCVMLTFRSGPINGEVVYFLQVESWCPRLFWRRHMKKKERRKPKVTTSFLLVIRDFHRDVTRSKKFIFLFYLALESIFEMITQILAKL